MTHIAKCTSKRFPCVYLKLFLEESYKVDTIITFFKTRKLRHNKLPNGLNITQLGGGGAKFRSQVV